MIFAMPASRRPSMSRAADWTHDQLASVGADIDPAERVSDLSTANRQLVEIAKALALDAKVLALDEPTESLTRVESERLFANIRSIRDKGTAVVYISHRLPEVKRVADRITVLRDGETRGTFDAAGISEGEILRLIIGRAVDQVFPGKRATEEEAAPLLEVGSLSGTGFRDVSLSVQPGEVVGLAGIEGNGQRSFLRALARGWRRGPSSAARANARSSLPRSSGSASGHPPPRPASPRCRAATSRRCCSHARCSGRRGYSWPTSRRAAWTPARGSTSIR